MSFNISLIASFATVFTLLCPYQPLYSCPVPETECSPIKTVGPELFEITVKDIIGLEQKRKFKLFGTLHSLEFEKLPLVLQEILLSGDHLIEEPIYDPIVEKNINGIPIKFIQAGYFNEFKQEWFGKLSSDLQDEVKSDLLKICEVSMDHLELDPAYLTPWGANEIAEMVTFLKGMDDYLQNEYRNKAKAVLGLETMNEAVLDEYQRWVAEAETRGVSEVEKMLEQRIMANRGIHARAELIKILESNSSSDSASYLQSTMDNLDSYLRAHEYDDEKWMLTT